MKKLILGISIFALMAGSAMAADAVVTYDPIPAPAFAPQSFVWTGGYVGLQAGYAWGKSTYTNTEYGDFANYDPDGFFGGIYAGYNHQLSNNVVLGIDGDINITGIDGATDFFWDGDSPAPVANSEVKYSGALRARLGYAMDRFMPYVAGGLSVAKYDFDLFDDGDLEFSESKTLAGWNIGAGIEYAATDNLLLRAEYRYSDFGSKSFDHDFAGGANIDLSTHDIRLGLAYKF